MEITRPGSRKTVEIDGKSFLLPNFVGTFIDKTNTPAIRLRIRIPWCAVNGKKVGRSCVVVNFSTKGQSMKNLVAMGALCQTLMPVSGPSQNKMNIIAAARIMERFDLEHPDSGILDTDVVTVSSKRHIYVRKSTFLASELRQLDTRVELTSLMASLLQDTAVISTTLDPAPVRTTYESAATARALLDAGVVKKKRTPLRSKGPRIVTCDDGTSWLLPTGVCFIERVKGQLTYKYLLLGVHVGLCQVNGRYVRQDVKIMHARASINKRTILALRATLEALFPVDESARDQVHRVVDAFVLRAFDQENPGSDILDETVVTVRIWRYGHLFESTHVAGDLRMTGQNEVIMMTELFLDDPKVISGELEPAPASASTGSSTHDPGSDTMSCKRAGEYRQAAATQLDEARVPNPTAEPACTSDATALGEKRKRSQGDVFRVGSRHKVDSLSLPPGIYLDAGESQTLRLKVKLGRVRVNGVECVFRKKMKIIGGVALHAHNVTALRSLRDDFALGLGASPRVKMIIAAKAFRSWQRRRQDRLVPDSTVVTITDGAGTPSTADLRLRIVSTAEALRRVDAEKPRVVRELLRGLCGIHLEREDELESEPSVIVKGAMDGEKLETREMIAPGVKETRVGNRTLDFSAQRPAKRKMRDSEESCRGRDKEVTGSTNEAKKSRGKGDRKVRECSSSRSGGQEGGEDGRDARKAEKTVIDLVSDSPESCTRRKKRQWEERGLSACGVKLSVAIGGTRKERRSAGESTKESARQEGGTGLPSTSHPEHMKERENRGERQPTRSVDSMRLGAPIKGRKRTRTEEAGKGNCSLNGVEQEGSAQASSDRKVKMDRNLAPDLSAKNSSKKKSKRKRLRDDLQLVDESTQSGGPMRSVAKKGEAEKESECCSSSRSPAPEGGAQECTVQIAEGVIVDLTADPPVSQIEAKKIVLNNKKKTKKKKSAKDRTQCCGLAGSPAEEANERNGKDNEVARATDSAGGKKDAVTRSSRWAQSREAAAHDVENGNPICKSRTTKLMGWIEHG
ncbi:unnamed protein product [Pylaiella littoralis]